MCEGDSLACVWSPDSSLLLLWRNGSKSVALVHAETGTIVVHLVLYQSLMRSPVWSPDGTAIAFDVVVSKGHCGLLMVSFAPLFWNTGSWVAGKECGDICAPRRVEVEAEEGDWLGPCQWAG